MSIDDIFGTPQKKNIFEKKIQIVVHYTKT